MEQPTPASRVRIPAAPRLADGLAQHFTDRHRLTRPLPGPDGGVYARSIADRLTFASVKLERLRRAVSGCAVGICAAVERVCWGPWKETVTMVPRSYVTAVQATGAAALLLPPDDAAAEAPDTLLDRIDALLLAGGADVDPGDLRRRAACRDAGTWPERDRFELALTRRALERGMPVLGICRGMQLLNVAAAAARSSSTFLTSSATATTATRRARSAITKSASRRVARGARGRRRAADGQVPPSPGSRRAGRRPDRQRLVDRRRARGGDRGRRPEFVLGVLWHPEEDERARSSRRSSRRRARRWAAR